MKNRFKIIFSLLFLALFFNINCAHLSYIKDPFVDIPNFSKVDDTLYRGGQPTQEGMRILKKTGIKTIIALRNPGKDLNREKEQAHSLGIEVINIPLSVYKIPEDQQVLEFLKTVTDTSKQPVYLHCTSGRDRTGAIVAVYRVIVSHWTIKQAYKEAKQKGFWPYHGDAVLKKFIHQLKDKGSYYEFMGRPVPPKPKKRGEE
ncbi:MAG: tyrosine-protein phosphatase [Candidatus Omnitrophica bacterium]|nr:tyrosine-protein phosphatase [Candidatus Omnitrophota bacterium]